MFILSLNDTRNPCSTPNISPYPTPAGTISKRASILIPNLPHPYTIHTLFFRMWRFTQWIFQFLPWNLVGTKRIPSNFGQELKPSANGPPPKDSFTNTAASHTKKVLRVLSPHGPKPGSLRWESGALLMHHSIADSHILKKHLFKFFIDNTISNETLSSISPQKRFWSHGKLV